MLCQKCGKNPANVHYTELIDNKMTEQYLCEKCAEEKGLESPLSLSKPQFSLGSLLAGMVKESIIKDRKEPIGLRCSSCGLSYTDFRQIGRLGCGNCYHAFREELLPLLRRIHGNNKHVGKIPSSHITTTKRIDERRKIKKLEQSLQKAIKEENYEEAAKIRDQIKKIENQLQKNKS